jgi:Dyp-type peroxidase family
MPITPNFAKIQANILKGHGRSHSWQLFLQFRPDVTTVDLRKWWHNFSNQLTSAAKQLSDTQKHKENNSFDGGMVTIACLSKNGYDRLGIAAAHCPDDPAFLHGMKNRELLSDPKPINWEQPFNQTIDAMILVADMKEDNLKKAVATITAGISPIATILHIQKGEVLKDGDIAIEHFGYADGVSQPLFLNEKKPGKVWDDNEPLDLVLVEENSGTTEKDYGSYFVFRKLEQNVAAFKAHEEELGELLFQNPADEALREIAGAYTVGRFEDSTPVVKHAAEKGIKREEDIDNDFNYSNDPKGMKCPFHAHIRLVNPRDITATDPHIHRLIRRGIPYDEIGRNGDLEFLPDGGVGLLFMCYQASIVNQFEVVQSNWANHGRVGNKKFAQDGIIGQGRNTTPQYWPLPWGSETALTGFTFKDFVQMKGGEYFFAPSISFFEKL